MSRIGRMHANGAFGKTPHSERTKPPLYGPDLFVFKDGEPMRVLRPEDAARKMATAGFTEAMAANPGSADVPLDAEAFDRSLSEQPHQFVGFAAKDGSILDRFGRVVGKVQPGDSFVGGAHFEVPAFMTTGHFHEEQWGAYTVLVIPRPDLKVDSNTGVVMKSPDASLLGAVVLRPGATGEPDCHLPSLNRIITGDPNKNYRGDPPPATT